MTKVSVILIILCTVFSFGLLSQEDNSLYGRVVIQNSKFETGEVKGVANVSISSIGSKPQITDNKGYFKLIFSNKYIGQKVNLKIKKKEYKVINQKFLEKNTTVGTVYPIEIVLAKQKVYDKEFLIYYNITSKYLLRNEVNPLIYKKDSIILIQGNKIDQSQNELEFKNKLCLDLAEKWATTNLDDLSKEYLEIFKYIKSGELEVALKRLDDIRFDIRFKENEDLISKSEKIINEKTRVRNEAIKQDEIDKEQLFQRARLKLLTLDLNGAKKDLSIGLSHDKKNLNFNLGMADLLFLSIDVNAIHYYENALNHNPSELTKAHIYFMMGKFYKNSQNFKEAECFLLKSEILNKKFFQSNNLHDDYIHNLIALGALYSKDGFEIPKKSKQYFEDAIALSTELYRKYPTKYAGAHFSCLMNMGISMYDLDKRAKIFSTNHEIYLKHNNQLGILMKIGFFYQYGSLMRRLYDLKKAAKYYKTAIDLIESRIPELSEISCDSNPDNSVLIEPVMPQIYFEFATLPYDKNDINEIDSCYRRAINLYCYLNLNHSYSGSIKLKLIRAKLRYGMFLFLNGDLESPKIILEEEVAEISDYSGNDLLNLAPVYQNIGILYGLFNQDDIAFQYFDESYKIYDQLYKINPERWFLDRLRLAFNYAKAYTLLKVKDSISKKAVIKRLKNSILYSNKPIYNSSEVIYVNSDAKKLLVELQN